MTKITNELLAAYAEGKVSDGERKEVRQYLIKHPSELESVIIMMDADYDLEPRGEFNDTGKLHAVGALAGSNAATGGTLIDMVRNAASRPSISFKGAKHMIGVNQETKAPKKNNFQDRLDNLLREIED